MISVALKVAYDGSPYRGFSRQEGLLTVQGSIEEALTQLYGRYIETSCAGRTDAGVHARAQVVAFDLSEEELGLRSLDTLQKSLNAFIDESSYIVDIALAGENFSARFDAKSRRYRYFISDCNTRNVIVANRAWAVKKPLNIDAMQKAGSYLLGEHDFKSFCLAASAKDKPTKRRLDEVRVFRQENFGENLVVIELSASSFLHSMVRTIAGTLVLVGTESKSPEWVYEVLQAKDRSAAGQCAPAHGLIFWNVEYDADRLKFNK